MYNCITCRIRPITEALADGSETPANVALTEITSSRIEIALRARAVGIAGGKGQG
jgi:hypothetical protein